MTRVYVETNFLVDLLRPREMRAAEKLFARHGGDVTLAIPWCSFSEAKRVLERVIREDLAFRSAAGRFMKILRGRDAALAAQVQAPVNLFLQAASETFDEKLAAYVSELGRLAARLVVLEPSPRATEIAVDVNRRKALKPFDEMILASVLADAEVQAAGTPMCFCSKDTKGFAPTPSNGLTDVYHAAGLSFLPDFLIP